MPAMPFIEKPEYQWNYSGLTKREHFAAMAMQGVLANHDGTDDIQWIAKASVKIADALLKELAK